MIISLGLVSCCLLAINVDSIIICYKIPAGKYTNYVLSKGKLKFLNLFLRKWDSMNIEEFREYCLKKKGVEESFPFDETTLVFKVMNKMFALTDLGGNFSINLKCDPEKAIVLRGEFHAVKPGFHMNKKHWNTINIDGTIADSLIREWIDESYTLVVQALTKKKKREIFDL